MMETQPGKTALPRILIAHPEASFTRLLAANLQGDYETVQANTAEDALELLNQHFAVIVITIIFPRIPGTKILEEIRRRGIATPVIIASAAFRKEQEELVRENTGVFGCLAQPFGLDRLKKMLEAAIASDGEGLGTERAPERSGEPPHVTETEASTNIERTPPPPTKKWWQVWK